jgi:hypothetical protein
MRYIKVFCLAVVVVAALTTAPTAMATGSTSLCRGNEEPCPAMKQYAAIHAIALNPVIKTSVNEITCEKSLLSATLLALGTPQIGHIQELTWTNCEEGEEEPCEVISLAVGLIDFLKIAAALATARLLNTQYLIECEETPFDCIYGGEPVFHALGAALPGHAGLISANELTMPKVGGFLCPVNNKYTANYEFLEDVFIST